jgi:hypothetical protein
MTEGSQVLRSGNDKGGPKTALSPDVIQADCCWQSSVVVDDDLATVVIDIPVVIAPLDDHGVAISVVVSVSNYLPLAYHVAVTVAFANGHADRTDADADFFCACRQCGSDKRRGRHNS